LALAREAHVDATEFLTALVAGYEIGSRLGAALHATAPDYHTSGAWVAVAVAVAGARLLRLSPEQTAHAAGIAEYHGPRSQMMRCIDHPTMVKDGSGWGAMAGVSAVLLARDGFTGAPALTLDTPEDIWADLGSHWLITEQYFKPYPVCRWAQPAVEGVLALCDENGLTANDVAHIDVTTFHEATRLATARPRSTEEAQYSTSFPIAVALMRGQMTASDIDGPALTDPEILRLSDGLVMSEDDEANARFPQDRLARVTLHLRDGDTVQTGWMEPRWTYQDPPSTEALVDKFHTLVDPLLGRDRAAALADTILTLEDGSLAALDAALSQPINAPT
ncbi:MAG: MmgE/PrpD family protein, partial [Rhodobacteraceae bacterium]|nr:MmgE/PrpD family protein [Paracoccaceae bacterium]